jgi:hypothetical protein
VILFTSLLNYGTILAIWAAVLAKGRIPTWLFDFQAGVHRWQVRAISFALLLVSEYPAFEGEYPVAYVIEHPDRVARWKLVVWKGLTAIPHFIALLFLSLSMVAVGVVAWFGLLFTGRYPALFRPYTIGFVRWGARVQAYVESLTDSYPPFSLSEEAAPIQGRKYALACGAGIVLSAAAIGGFVAVILNTGEEVTRQVSYEELLSGSFDSSPTSAHVISATTELTGASDPAAEHVGISPLNDHRLVSFNLMLQATRPGDDVIVRANDFRLKHGGGDVSGPLLVLVNGRPAPANLGRNGTAEVTLMFEIPRPARPRELRYDVVKYLEWPTNAREVIIYELQ